MILLDTNIISELWKAAPDSKVLAWVDAQAVETLYLSAITVAEIRFGLATMPTGKRRAIYQERLEGEVLPIFAGRVLPFDLEASQAYANLMARTMAAGKAVGKADGYIAAIAAIAAIRGFSIATRDVAPFRAVGLNVINPWEL
jgi:predicted nucleic acid-binding protein